MTAEEQSRLEAIFASVKDAILTVDPRFVVIDALAKTGWNKSRAARLLGIGCR
ncbi:MAG: helix-turn-helix domain-containing protein [Smithellaceae bacterium]|nr:helix-turn-helix domain-containing protein [Smithellaceae bacterium]